MGLPALKTEMPPEEQSTQYESRAESVRLSVMTYVVEENYDLAIGELRKFMMARSDYPQFKPRAKRYIEHSIDIINAIKAKRNFPGIKSLTMAKQQELNDRVRNHFDELQIILKKVEKIQRELKIEDVRSTVWVIRAAMNAAVIIFAIAFVSEVSGGLLRTVYIVTDDLVGNFSNWIFNLLGF